MRPWFRPASRLRGPRSCHDVPMTTTASPGAPPGTRRGSGALPRPPLRRPLRAGAPGPGWATRPGRLIAGVAAGLADHLGLPVIRVRAILVAAGVFGGSGALLYLLLWALVPAGDPRAEASGAVPPARARLVPPPGARAAGGQRPGPRARALLGGVALLLVAALIAVRRSGLGPDAGWFPPVLVITAGAALAWSQVDAVTGPARDRGALLRLAGGVVLAIVGILLWIGAGTPPRVLLTGALTGGALVLGVGLILAPLWLRTNRALADTRAAEAREAERADIAAHLHDSVLQTLTLIRKRADEPGAVARLARSQERELRAWLYTDRPEAGTSVADAVRDLVGEIEDRYGAEVELVVVGDRPPDRATEVVVAAAREALSNAVRHGAPPVSVYAEIGPERLEVFVRDRGPGFDIDRIPPDRHGVRESIVSRMARHGGRAVVRRLEAGTEIHLDLPTVPPPPAAPPGA